MQEQTKKIYTDDVISNYKDYLPDDWFEKILATANEETVLGQLIFELCLSWRSSSYTAQMPANAILAIHASAVGRSGHISPDTSIVVYSEQIIKQLNKRIPEFFESSKLRSQVTSELVNVSAEFREKIANMKIEIPIDPIWADFMKTYAFRISLWSSQRISYVAFYNGYEAFLVDCIKFALNVPSLRTTKDEFKNGLRTGLAKDLSIPCWFHSEIYLSRTVRHALSHNGGRLTSDLKKIKHDIVVIDDELHIVPSDIKKMLRRFQSAIDELIDTAKNHPRLSMPANELAEFRLK